MPDQPAAEIVNLKGEINLTWDGIEFYGNHKDKTPHLINKQEYNRSCADKKRGTLKNEKKKKMVGTNGYDVLVLFHGQIKNEYTLGFLRN